MEAEAFVPERLSAAVERIDAWLMANNPIASRALQKGISAEAVLDRMGADGCRPPQELVDLWGLRNGMRADTDLPYVWYHRFLSVEDAIARRQTFREAVSRASVPVPADWLPIFEFEGEYYFTRCQAWHGGGAAVWHWSGEEPEVRLVYRSVTAMLETSAELYQRGAVWVTDLATGALDMDIRRVRTIYAERNPDGTFPYYVSPS